MKNIKLISLILLATLFIFSSCDKEDDPNPDEMYRVFLNEKAPLISGLLNDTTINWRFDRKYQTMNYKSDISDQEHSLNFGLIDKESTSSFFIRTPSFDKNVNILESPILARGNKMIGLKNNAFVLTYEDTMGNSYRTDVDGDQTGSSIEILKTEKTDSPFGRDAILVWFVVNCKLYNPDDNSQITLKTREY